MTRISLPETAHRFIKDSLKNGDIAIDATLGNGHDAFFLAELVGAQGHVYGFDIQAEAVENTKRRLSASGLLDRITLFQASHAAMERFIPHPHHDHIQAIMFNLGYLPGGDKTVITRTESTLAALNAACNLLAPGGRLSVLAYPGHAGGDSEAEAVQNWLATLEAGRFEHSTELSAVHKAQAPRLYRIEKQQ